MMDLQVVYNILRQIARNGGTRTYTQLSELYNQYVGVWHEPHGSWDMPLDTINKRLERAGLPPISAVIVNQDTNEPGGGFWGCCARTTRTFQNSDERQLEHARILQEVYTAAWPATLPG